MVGELAVSFCERKKEESGMCIDIWSYPDGTCNIVVSAVIGSKLHELSFPCAPYQFEDVLKGKPFSTSNEDGSILIEKCSDAVCAEYESLKSGCKARQCMPLENFHRAVDSLLNGAIGYLA